MFIRREANRDAAIELNRKTMRSKRSQLEHSHSGEKLTYRPDPKKYSTGDYQLSFIQLDDPLLLQIKEDILNMDINTLTPVEAFMKLNEIKKLLGE